jgi:hypothetical protein
MIRSPLNASKCEPQNARAVEDIVLFDLHHGKLASLGRSVFRSASHWSRETMGGCGIVLVVIYASSRVKCVSSLSRTASQPPLRSDASRHRREHSVEFAERWRSEKDALLERGFLCKIEHLSGHFYTDSIRIRAHA